MLFNKVSFVTFPIFKTKNLIKAIIIKKLQERENLHLLIFNLIKDI